MMRASDNSRRVEPPGVRSVAKSALLDGVRTSARSNVETFLKYNCVERTYYPKSIYRRQQRSNVLRAYSYWLEGVQGRPHAGVWGVPNLLFFVLPSPHFSWGEG